MSKILIIYPSNLLFESRLEKVAESLSKYADVEHVYIVGINSSNLKNTEELGPKITMIRIPLALNVKIPYLASLLTFIEWYIRIIAIFFNMKISIVHCNSIDDILVGVFLKLIKKDIKLIYDAMELETETDWLHGVKKKSKKLLERIAIRYVDHVIVVSESIKKWYGQKYQMVKKIDVIRNVPKHSEVLSNTSNIKQRYNISPNEILFVYHGVLNKARGVHILLNLFRTVEIDRHIVFMGYGPLLQDVKAMESRFKNIHYHLPVKMNEINKIISGADVGIHMIQNTCLNHYYCLPNKIFEYLMANLPIMVKNFPDMAFIVNKYNCGWTINSKFQDILNIINSITLKEINDKKKNTVYAKRDLNWGNEEKILLNIYSELLQKDVIKN